MDIIISVAQFFCALSLLVLLHEFGHYFFAKLFKTRVERFYLFFDFLFPLSNVLPFSIWKKKIGDTQYGIGWFPLGGYVKIAGMVDESMDTDQLKQPPQPWEFRSKPAWQRLLIMLGGIIVNVLVAFFIYAMVLYTWGEKKLPMSELKSGIVVVDSVAYQLGFKDNDKIIAADGQPIQYYDDLIAKVVVASEVTVNRNGKDTIIQLPVDILGQLSSQKNLKGLFSIALPTIISEVVTGSPAEAAGLLPNDKIISVNGLETLSFYEFRAALQNNKGQTVPLGIIRNNTELFVPSTVSDSGMLGFRPLAPTKVEELEFFGFKLDTREFGFLESFPAGVALTGKRLGMYVDQFKKVINPETGAYKGIGGFASMTKMFKPTWDWHHFWSMTAFISIMLAFMNLLPIPGLDGGYVVFTLYEMIFRRKPNQKFLEVATTFGLLIILAFMLFANGMDVLRFFR